MIPRAAAELFAAAARDPLHSYHVTMSYIQVWACGGPVMGCAVLGGLLWAAVR